MKQLTKRAIDVAVSGALLLMLWPLMLCVSLAIRLSMGSPVVFRQDRPGLDGRSFEMFKFRTMAPGTIADRPEGAISDQHRVTSLGHFLRSTSMDELPELMNVLLGDMSLVGPRPLLTEYLQHYDEQQSRRHEMKPGITGLAQVEGRNALSWDERLALDVRYVDTWTLTGDALILLQTLKVAVSREGVEDTVDNFDIWVKQRDQTKKVVDGRE